MGRNNYFKFKQFTIHQDNAAMKVGTDGVLLGAWASVHNVKSILDIGTGTGLIALMLAQRCNATLVAIDKEASACIDARNNVNRSPWKNRVTILDTSLQEYLNNVPSQFDCVVCNPPYFTNSVKSGDIKRTLARHNDQLPFGILAEGVSHLLTPDGHFAVILPVSEEREFRMQAANFRLFPTRITRVKPKPSVPASRVLIEFMPEGTPGKEEEVTIETETHHEYQPEFTELVKDFYLNL